MNVELFRADELAPGQVRLVQLDKLAVVIVRKADGTFRALRNRCAHQGGPLSEGTLQPLVVGSDVGMYEFRTDKDVLVCPWHRFEYDVDTGRSPADPDRIRVRSYKVVVEDGKLFIEP